MASSNTLTLEEYNEEVYYCKSCHSLFVLQDEMLANENWDGSYCGKCHSTNIGVCKLGEWLAEEEERRRKQEIREWNK